MKYLIKLALLSSLLLIVSCGAVVRTKVNTFRLDGVELAQGSVKVVYKGEGQASLEYDYYSKHLSTALNGLGYTVVDKEQASDYIAFLYYSVKESEDDRSSAGGSYIYSSSRNLGFGLKPGVIVIDEGKNRLLYERTFQLVIAQAENEQARVYEVSGVSRGRCGTLSVVFEEMLQAMLTGFPANNGSLRSVSVAGDTNC